MRKYWFEWRHASLDDRAACKQMIKHGSRSFYAASLLLPAELRQPSYAIYSFCRIADDDVDEGDSPAAAIRNLRRRLDAVYKSEPIDHACDRALTDVVNLYHIPRTLFDALLEGLEWDDSGLSYETIDDLHAYAARVASAVGAIMTCLMGRREPSTLARACDLGVAMQLTNIARDVGADARLGRVYLPHQWLREVGIEPNDLIENPKWSEELGCVIKRLLDHADLLYARSITGICALPLNCRPSINAARLIYADIGREISENGYDSITKRAVVSKRRKLLLALKATAQAPFISGSAKAPALSETRFLINAVSNHSANHRQRAGDDIDSQIGWIIDLFQTLDDRSKQRNPSQRDDFTKQPAQVR